LLIGLPNTIYLYQKVFIVALSGFASYANHQDPTHYIAQQASYRALELLYCAFVLYVLRVPPEIERRADYSELSS
jgi:hypothetical protein